VLAKGNRHIPMDGGEGTMSSHIKRVELDCNVKTIDQDKEKICNALKSWLDDNVEHIEEYVVSAVG